MNIFGIERGKPGKEPDTYKKTPSQRGGYPKNWVESSKTSATVEKGLLKGLFGGGGGGDSQGYSSEPAAEAPSTPGTKYYHDGKAVHWVPDGGRKNGHWEDEKGKYVHDYGTVPNGIKR